MNPRTLTHMDALLNKFDRKTFKSPGKIIGLPGPYKNPLKKEMNPRTLGRMETLPNKFESKTLENSGGISWNTGYST